MIEGDTGATRKNAEDTTGIVIEVAAVTMIGGVIQIGDIAMNLGEATRMRMIAEEETTITAEDIMTEMIVGKETTIIAEDMVGTTDILIAAAQLCHPMMIFTKKYDDGNEPM